VIYSNNAQDQSMLVFGGEVNDIATGDLYEYKIDEKSK
jgi:hypothetical protein